MVEYLSNAKDLLAKFKKCEVRQIPKSKNANVDSLTRLAVAYETELSRTVSVEVLFKPTVVIN